MTKKVADEKASFLADFSDKCLRRGLNNPGKLTPQFAHEFLAAMNYQRGPHVANKARKHIVAAWNWGYDFIDDFPDRQSPFRSAAFHHLDQLGFGHAHGPGGGGKSAGQAVAQLPAQYFHADHALAHHLLQGVKGVFGLLASQS